MITVRIVDLLNSVDILRKLATQDFKAKVAWSISRLLRSAESEIQSFNDTRMDLLRKYGEKDENGELVTDERGNCRVPQEQLGQFNVELNELAQTEVEINGNKIPIDQLDGCNFTPTEITILEPFIEE